MNTRNVRFAALIIAAGALYAGASNLANPAVAIPEARIAVGASYYLGGHTITNREIRSIFNRIHARVEYAPIRFASIGADLGATQIDVDKVGSGKDSIPVFHGKFGFSGGGHLKLSTPFMLNKMIAIMAIGQGTFFSSENEHGAVYSGFDGIGTVGVQLHIPRFGFVTAGPQLYLIKGENQGYTGTKGRFSNVNNLRGWLAIDYFPKVNAMSSNRPYFSIEFSATPKADYSREIFVQEYSVSICIGAVTRRLYGVESDVEWEP